MSSSSHAEPRRSPTSPPPTKWVAVAGLGVVGAVVVAVLVLAFLWPTKTSETRNLPVGIAGPAQSVATLEKALGTASPNVFDFVAATDRADAVDQIRSRDTYGAIVLGNTPTSVEVLTAPAGSAAATQLLTTIATQLQARLTQQVAAAGGDSSTVKVPVTAVVPFAESDPSGVGLAATSFPLMMGGMIGGILTSLAVVGVTRRLVTLLGFGVATGLILTLVLQTWFDYLQGDFWLNVAGMGLSVVATSAFIVGCASLVGRAGVAIGAVFTMLIGNPISASATPWQFLAHPWGAIGQYLVPGAGNNLIRTLSYFPDADATQQWLTLVGWVALGVIMALIGHYRSRPETHVTDSISETVNPDGRSAVAAS
ncbi:hypothetical protein [Nocardia alni]|uniref:hypothetical protein n=1 Tax=Nocardia alni TaxID=2815723 RepID=UPI001C23EBC4|nr:hypothetical protein [Nocardia alni]